jgi:hypothetical protein
MEPRLLGDVTPARIRAHLRNPFIVEASVLSAAALGKHLEQESTENFGLRTFKHTPHLFTGSYPSCNEFY